MTRTNRPPFRGPIRAICAIRCSKVLTEQKAGEPEWGTAFAVVLWFIFSRNRSSFLPATGTEQKNHGRTRFCGISRFHFR